MLSFQAKFVQTDGQTDGRTMVKQYAPFFRCWGIKKNAVWLPKTLMQQNNSSISYSYLISKIMTSKEIVKTANFVMS